MGRYVKSVADTRELSKSIKELVDEFSYHKKAVEKNNNELSKINAQVELTKVKEIKALEEKIHKLESETRWVRSSEPAIKVTGDYMLKKLDIL